MAQESKGKISEICSCLKPQAQKHWFIGIAIVVLITIFSLAMFHPKEEPAQMVAGQGNFYGPGQRYSQQAIQSFPQGGMQQAAFRTQGIAPVLCPYCGFSASSPIFSPNGMLTCPNCARNIVLPVGPHGGGFTQVALPHTIATCPNPAQCFPQQTPGGGFAPVAFTNPIAPPPITRNAIMPHEYRGVCSNCHQILGGIR
jgi:hypothetical protein